MTVRSAALLSFLLPIVVLVALQYVRAASLTFVSDLITDSAPSASANHTIQFTLPNSIPASGSIVITPEGAFAIPGGFTYTSVDIAVNSIDRDVAASASATEDGVSISSASGPITITLNSSSGISAGSIVQIEFGTNASHQISGVSELTNPAGVGSYRIRINTYDQSSALIDNGAAMIAIVSPVTTSAVSVAVPPTRFNGLPSGAIAAGNTTIELSLETDKLANCRYATSTGVTYSAMTASFTTPNNLLFYTTLTGFQNNTTYTYYVRCVDTVLLVENTNDYTITFTLDSDPISNTSISDPNGVSGITGTVFLGRGGTGDIRNGSDVLYLASVTLSGRTSPQSTVAVLKDGVPYTTVRSRSDGAFSSTITNLERGTYTISAYTLDSALRKSGIVSSTLTLGQGTNNTISNVIVPPTIELENTSIGLGESALLSGESVPNSAIHLFVQLRSTTTPLTAPKQFNATTTGAGKWSVEVPANTFSRGVFVMRARSIVSAQEQSDLSDAVYLGVGESAPVNLNSRADINKDGRVNLVDFSILLSFWNSSNVSVDINLDGTINLADFSILLFNWTG